MNGGRTGAVRVDFLSVQEFVAVGPVIHYIEEGMTIFIGQVSDVIYVLPDFSASEQKVTFSRAFSLSVDAKEYSLVRDLLTLKEVHNSHAPP